MLWIEMERKSRILKLFLAVLLFLPHQVHLSPHAVLPLSLNSLISLLMLLQFCYFPLMVTYLISRVFCSVSFPCLSTFPFCN